MLYLVEWLEDSPLVRLEDSPHNASLFIPNFFFMLQLQPWNSEVNHPPTPLQHKYIYRPNGTGAFQVFVSPRSKRGVCPSLWWGQTPTGFPTALDVLPLSQSLP